MDTPPVRIDQFTPSISMGDGVSQGVFYTQRLLRELGYQSAIFARHIADELANDVTHVHSYQPRPEDLLLYHFAISHEDHQMLMEKPMRKVLVYHNITPAHFFPENVFLQNACEMGREQIATSVQRFEAAYGDSDYNCRELRALGYANPVVMPILLDFEEVAPPSHSNSGKETLELLFVGRIVANKCQHLLIDLLYYLREQLAIPARLTLAGGISQPEYAESLHQQIVLYGLEEHCHITGRVSDQQLAQLYENADFFISLSNHEGFCIPLLEAVRAGIPVLAYPAGGIPETVGKAGLLRGRAAATVATALQEIWLCPEKRRALLEAQQTVARRFSRLPTRQRLQQFLKTLGL